MNRWKIATIIVWLIAIALWTGLIYDWYYQENMFVITYEYQNKDISGIKTLANCYYPSGLTADDIVDIIEEEGEKYNYSVVVITNIYKTTTVCGARK